MKILVGYASAHGSTAEIAEFIGKEIEQREFEVTVANVADVTSMEGYDAYVVGSAIHGGMWLSEMSQFLERNEAQLKQLPGAFFITAIRVLEPDGYEHCLREYVNHRVLDNLNITNLTVFAGLLNLDAVEWEERWTLAARYDGKNLPGTMSNDFRDWDKIRQWTQSTVDQFLLA